MPLIHLPFVNGQPMIQAYIGVSLPRAQAMTSIGITVPPPVLLNFLIDTGAGLTAVDPLAVAPLGLTPSGTVSIQTPSTGSTPNPCNQYDVSILVPAPTGAPFILDAHPVVEASLKHQSIDGLLGRDVLRGCVLFYNSPLDGFTLAY